MNKKLIFPLFCLAIGLIIGSFIFIKTARVAQGIGRSSGAIREAVQPAEKAMMEEAGQPERETKRSFPEDIIEKMPRVKFIFPDKRTALKGKVKIKNEVKGASSIEFYLRKPESLTKIYLGRGILSKDNFWEYSLNTDSIPNGRYYLIPKIANQYGEYTGSAADITIRNETKRNEEEEKNLKEEISKAEETVGRKDKVIGRTESRMKEDIQKSVEQLVQETQAVLGESQKRAIKDKVSEELKKSSGEIEKGVKKFIGKIKEETRVSGDDLEKVKKEKEEIKKEILRKATEPIEKIKEEAGESVKPKISEDKGRAKGEIESILDKMGKEIAEIEKSKKKAAERLSKDSDNDGLPDYEEIQLKTDPFNPDTDGDGVLDGTEIAEGYDPLNPSPADKIIYQDPRKTKPKETNTYKVEKVSMAPLPSGGLGLKLEGRGKPNSFVTIYVFSSFLTLVTKTNENGYWEYVLDKPLEKGEHEVYVAITNNQGKIVAESEPFKFIKTSVAVAAVVPPSKKAISPGEALQRSFLILITGLIVLTIGIALVIIGISTKKGPKPDIER